VLPSLKVPHQLPAAAKVLVRDIPASAIATGAIVRMIVSSAGEGVSQPRSSIEQARPSPADNLPGLQKPCEDGRRAEFNRAPPPRPERRPIDHRPVRPWGKEADISELAGGLPVTFSKLRSTFQMIILI